MEWKQVSLLEMEDAYRMELVSAALAVNEIDVYLSDFLDYLTEVLIKLRWGLQLQLPPDEIC